MLQLRISFGIFGGLSLPPPVHPWNHLWIVQQVDPSNISESSLTLPSHIKILTLFYRSLYLDVDLNSISDINI